MSSPLWQRLLPSLAVLASIVSLCLGTSFAKQLFPEVGAQGTTALRVGFSALLLLLIWRPWRFRLQRSQLAQLAAFGTVLGLMNLLFYLALTRMPFGVTVAMMFLGPLSVAVWNSRHWLDLLWIVLAALGLAVLLLLPLLGSQLSARLAALDPIGLLLTLCASACWGSYIVLGKRASQMHGGLVVSMGLLVAAIVVVPFGVAEAGSKLLAPEILLYGLAVAIVSSAIPFTLEAFALKRLSHSAFSTLVATEPAVAALAGTLLLGEQLSPSQWIAILTIMGAAMGSALTARPAVPDTQPAKGTATQS